MQIIHIHTKKLAIHIHNKNKLNAIINSTVDSVFGAKSMPPRYDVTGALEVANLINEAHSNSALYTHTDL